MFPFQFYSGLDMRTSKYNSTNIFNPSYENLIPFMSGSLAGGIAAAVTTPLDVVKTHMQVDIGEVKRVGLGAGSPINVMRNVMKIHGLQGLMVGLVPRCAKIIPACAIMITSYEAGKSFFTKL